MSIFFVGGLLRVHGPEFPVGRRALNVSRCTCCCCCCWFLPQVCEGCPNYEVVVFQPCTFPTWHLGFVVYCQYFIYLSARTFYYPVVWIVLLSFCLTSYPSVAIPVWNPLNFTRSPHILPVQSASHMDADVARTRRPPVYAACNCAPLCVPVYVSITVLVCFSLCRPLSTPRFCWTLCWFLGMLYFSSYIFQRRKSFDHG